MTHDYAGLQRLAFRRNQALATMSVLSEAACSQWVGDREEKGKAKGNKSESREPTAAGVHWSDDGRAQFGAWQADKPLYDHWVEVFRDDWPDVEGLPENPDQAALDWCHDRAYRLVMQAEADLHAATGNLDTTTPGDPAARDKRIVKAYEGRPAVEVAHLERCSTASVRAIRRQFGRDPLLGLQAKKDAGPKKRGRKA